MDSQCGAVKSEELSVGEMWFRIDSENSTTLKKKASRGKTRRGLAGASEKTIRVEHVSR